MAVPYSHQSNGRCEAHAGLLKTEAAIQLLHAKLGVAWWPEALEGAAYLRRQRMLGLKIPGDNPQMGDAVAIQREVSEAFVEKAEIGVFLCHDSQTLGGAKVLVLRNGVLRAQRCRLPILLDQPRARWRQVLEPNGSRDIWVSTTGQVLWEPPQTGDMLTLEERTGEIGGPTEDEITRIIRQRAQEKSGADEQAVFNLFNHGILWKKLEEEPAVALHALGSLPKQDKDASSLKCKGDKARDRYFVLAYDIEQAMNMHEQSLANQAALEVSESVPQSILTDSRTSPEELHKWLTEGVGTELDNLAQKEVYDEVERDQLPAGVKAIPTKLVLTRKPDDKPQEDVEAETSATTAALKGWRAKARLVACGNWEQGTSPHAPENQSLNPGSEAIRIGASLLARNEHFGCVSGIPECQDPWRGRVCFSSASPGEAWNCQWISLVAFT